jgi:heme-degrading monooxygenase HmoA
MASMAARIVRVWKGYGSAQGVERYCADHFTNTVLPQLRAVNGFVSANVLVRVLDGETEVVVATVWDSIHAIKRFAGEDEDAAVVEPVVRDILDRFDDRVTHFTVAISTDTG